MSVNQTSNLDRAVAAWGAGMPEWVRLLAAACDRTSQRQVAEALGKSHPYINRIVRRDYAGNYREAELLVRSRYSSDEVDCPALGPIKLAACVRNRRHPRTQHNAFTQLLAHCGSCPLNSDIPED